MQNCARQRKEISPGMRILQARANPCNTRTITRKDGGSAAGKKSRRADLRTKPVKTISLRCSYRGHCQQYVSSRLYPRASRPVLACYKCVRGTAGRVGESSSVDHPSDVPESRQARQCRKSFARVPRKKVRRTPAYAGSRANSASNSATRAPGDAAAVRRAICGLVCSSGRLIERGSVHSCSQYLTRPPLWHTKRTPPS